MLSTGEFFLIIGIATALLFEILFFIFIITKINKYFENKKKNPQVDENNSENNETDEVDGLRPAEENFQDGAHYIVNYQGKLVRSYDIDYSQIYNNAEEDFENDATNKNDIIENNSNNTNEDDNDPIKNNKKLFDKKENL